MLTSICLKSTFLSNVKYSQGTSLYNDECKACTCDGSNTITFVINISIHNH